MYNTLIKLENAGVYYRTGRNKSSPASWPLRGLTLDIKKGDKLGIVGRNGCGKSTLLKLLAGIISVDEGQIKYTQKNINVQLLALGVGFEGNLSGSENAVLSGLYMNKSRREMEFKLSQIQEFSGLGNAFSNPINTYSSGMNARLGFSIALQTDPDVFLIDEILGVGDHAFQLKSQMALREKIKPETTVVLISHDARLISQICTRSIWLDKGRILAEGKPDEVCSKYENAPL